MAFTPRTQTSNDLISWRKEQNTKQTGSFTGKEQDTKQTGSITGKEQNTKQIGSITGKEWKITDFLKYFTNMYEKLGEGDGVKTINRPILS
jgi:hypothetical protein